MSLLTIGGRNDGPLKDITNSVVETPRTSFNKTKTRNPEVGFAPKKSNNDSPTQLSTTGRRLQFEDENTLQSINIRPPNDIQDRSKCIRKKYQAENQDESHLTPQKKIPLLFGANVSVDSPDPLSKYNSQAPEKYRPTNVTSLTRILQETKLEQSPDCIADDIYDFSTSTSKVTLSTSKYKGSTISDVIRGTFVDEFDAEHKSSNVHEPETLLLPKDSLNEDEDRLFQQMTSHRKKKSASHSLQPLSSSLDGLSAVQSSTNKISSERITGKSIDTALSTMIEPPHPSTNLSVSLSSNDLLKVRPSPPADPPKHRSYTRPVPPSTLSNSVSLSALQPNDASSPNSVDNQSFNKVDYGKSRPGRRYSMARKGTVTTIDKLEDSLETFSIPRPDAVESSASEQHAKHSTSTRKVLISGVSKQAMQYLLLQANKKRRRRGKASNSFIPKFESIPEDTILDFPVSSRVSLEGNRMADPFSVPKNIPSDYISWMIDEYMTNDADVDADVDANGDDVDSDNCEFIDYDDGEEYEKKILFKSIKNYNTKVFKEIISRNPSCIYYRDEYGNTPLMIATIVGWRKAIKILIKNGSDLNSQNHKGNTCCHYAFILPNYSDIQKYFIRKKADIRITNERHYTCKYEYLIPSKAIF